jgi:HPt (histidine-containing phosphotransfer) domain-containing protein
MKWDIQELLSRLDGDRPFLCELLQVFCQDSQTNLQQAKSALAAADLPELARAAHTLKGMLRALSMNCAAETAAGLENAARQGNGRDAQALLIQLELALADLLSDVNAQLAEVNE